MKKTLYLARCILVLMVTMFAAMCYAPTASAKTGPPTDHFLDVGKMVKADQMATISVPSVAECKRIYLFSTRQWLKTSDHSASKALFMTKQRIFDLHPVGYKDDPHIT